MGRRLRVAGCGLRCAGLGWGRVYDQQRLPHKAPPAAAKAGQAPIAPTPTALACRLTPDSSRCRPAGPPWALRRSASRIEMAAGIPSSVQLNRCMQVCGSGGRGAGHQASLPHARRQVPGHGLPGLACTPAAASSGARGSGGGERQARPLAASWTAPKGSSPAAQSSSPAQRSRAACPTAARRAPAHRQQVARVPPLGHQRHHMDRHQQGERQLRVEAGGV